MSIKGLNSIGLVILLTALVASAIFVPLRAEALGNVVDSTYYGEHSVFATTHNSFYAEGTTWVFANGGYYSGNGSSWGSKQTYNDANVTLGTISGLAVDYRDPYVYIAANTYWQGNTAITFRRGQPLGNGTILWSADWQKVRGLPTGYSMFCDVSVAADDLGYAWISFVDYDAYLYNSTHDYVMGGNSTDGTWQTDSTKTAEVWSMGGFPGTSCEVVGLAATAAVIYSGNNGPIYARIYDTSAHSWGDAATEPLNCLSLFDVYNASVCAAFSTCRDENDVDIAFTDTSGNIYFTWLATFADGYDIATPQLLYAAGANRPPSVAKSTYNGDVYVWWTNAPVSNHLYYKKLTWAAGTWGPLVDVGVESDGISGYWNCGYNAINPAPDDKLGFLYDSGSYLKTYLLAGNLTGAHPYGDTLAASSVTQSSATLNGITVSDAGQNVTAEICYRQVVSAYAATCIDVGATWSGQHFSAAVAGLVPDNQYAVWCEWYEANSTLPVYTGDVVYFSTLATSEVTTPTVTTNPITGLGNTSAILNGVLDYDGGDNCQVGFEWRVYGTVDWLTGWSNTIFLHPMVLPIPLATVGTVNMQTPYNFSASLSNLLSNTEYEYRAIAKNSMNAAGSPSVGNISTFTTFYGAATNPTPTPSGGGGGSNTYHVFWGSITLTANEKLWLSLAATIGGMVLLAILLSSKGASNASGYVILGYGLASVIGLAAINWYPFYVLYLIGGIVALALLLTLAGRGGGKAAPE